jgi:hypothetical protein
MASSLSVGAGET